MVEGFASVRIMGNRLMVGRRSLTPLILVRVQVPQPTLFLVICQRLNGTWHYALSLRFERWPFTIYFAL